RRCQNSMIRAAMIRRRAFIAGAVGAALLPIRPAAAAAPDRFRVRLETSKGAIDIDVHRDWCPHGADRFHELGTSGYLDDNRFFLVVAGRWAPLRINGAP